MRWAWHVAGIGESRGIYRVLAKEKPEGKKQFVRSRRRWEYNVRDGSSRSGMWEYGLDRAGLGEGTGGGHL